MNLFKAEELKTNANVKILPVADNQWSFEMEILLQDELLKSLKEKKMLYAKLCVELNSANEFSILGATGDFWAANNYSILQMR